MGKKIEQEQSSERVINQVKINFFNIRNLLFNKKLKIKVSKKINNYEKNL